QAMTFTLHRILGNLWFPDLLLEPTYVNHAARLMWIATALFFVIDYSLSRYFPTTQEKQHPLTVQTPPNVEIFGSIFILFLVCLLPFIPRLQVMGEIILPFFILLLLLPKRENLFETSWSVAATLLLFPLITFCLSGSTRYYFLVAQVLVL